jgi:hypothetical protein
MTAAFRRAEASAEAEVTALIMADETSPETLTAP